MYVSWNRNGVYFNPRYINLTTGKECIVYLISLLIYEHLKPIRISYLEADVFGDRYFPFYSKAVTYWSPPENPLLFVVSQICDLSP